MCLADLVGICEQGIFSRESLAMDGFFKQCFAIAYIIGTFFLSPFNYVYANAGYFQMHNLMSAAQKNIPNNLFFNDLKLNLEALEKNSGHVVNTQFSNDGGMAGCGVSSTLMTYMYQNRGATDLSKNYIALNVYSQVPGFDPQAPFWGNPEGQLKGYLTQGSVPTNIAYPFTPYHRVIPSLYPAYLGLYNNGLNCGRWVEADFDNQSCQDRTSPLGISKFCPSVGSLTYTGQKMLGYVFDSCEDNNGWCRDDAAHIDVNPLALTNPANYYLQWKFVKNPYYSDTNAPAFFKDIWLAWFSQASKYWSYVAILNVENGISNVQYNIGDPTNRTWINSHVLAGDNNVTWSSTSNNGQLWQIEPVNSLVDTAPPDNPLYQMRIYDYLGYPANHGTIYQFQLLFGDGTLGNSVGGYYFFYQGGATVKPGPQTQNMTLLRAPVGNGKITVAFNQLVPSNFTLNASQPNYLRPVLISDDGFAWDADQCANNQCVFSNLPTTATYHVFAHAIEDVSNDLTLRKVNDVAFYSDNITFPSGAITVNYTLKDSERNLSTLYSARIQIPLKFAVTNNAAINGNLQALFIPDNSRNAANNITAQTQGCFLNTYVNTLTDANNNQYKGNNSICTVYYTVNHLSNFSTASPPAAFFNVVLPAKIGFDTFNFNLSASYNNPVQVTGYNPAGSPLPAAQSVPLANYVQGTGAARTLYLLLDPASDAACLQNLDPVMGVSVTIGNAAPINLTKADVPLETQLTQTTTTLGATVNLTGNANISCQAMPAIQPTASAPLKPGIDVVEVIKLSVTPTVLPPKPSNRGIAAVSVGDSACLGGADTLLFSTNGNVAQSVAYTTKTTTTNITLDVAPGTYTISDKAFKVAGGTCQLSNAPVVTIQTNTFTPVSLNYKFTGTPGGTCTALAQVTATWPNGCNVQFTLSSNGPLQNVKLSWQKGMIDWSRAQVWGGEGSLNIPADPTGNVTWLLPSWVNGQGQIVGMTVNNDSSPPICTAFLRKKTSLIVNCAGISPSKQRL